MDLFLLTLINIFNYLDRILIQAVKPSLLNEWSLSEEKAGYLISALVVGYCLFAPIFGILAQKYKRPKIMSLGIFLWSLATVASGLATSYSGLLLSRVFVGIGEASFATICPSYIKDRFKDPIKINKALSIFSAAIPIGSALGFVLGGIVTEKLSWHYTFFLGGIPGLVLCYFVYRLPEINSIESINEEIKNLNIKESIHKLLSIKIIRYSIIGYMFNTFALQGIAATVVKFGMEHGFSQSEIGSYFGAILVVTGFVGSIGGGYLSSYFASKATMSKDRTLLLFVTICALISVPLLFLAVYAENKYMFLFFCFLAELFIFGGVTPLNTILVICSPSQLVSLTQGITIASINIFGSFLSPIVLGIVADRTNLRTAMYLCPVALFLSFVSWYLGCRENKNKIKN